MKIEKLPDIYKVPHLSRDIVGYLMPGFLPLIIAYYIQPEFLKKLIKIINLETLSGIILGIIIAYVLGRSIYTLSIDIVNLISFLIQTRWRKRKEKRKSLWLYLKFRFLGSSDKKTFTEEDDRYIDTTEAIKYLSDYPTIINTFERQVLNQMFCVNMFGISLLIAFLFSIYWFIIIAVFFLIFSLRQYVSIDTWSETLMRIAAKEKFKEKRKEKNK